MAGYRIFSSNSSSSSNSCIYLIVVGVGIIALPLYGVSDDCSRMNSSNCCSNNGYSSMIDLVASWRALSPDPWRTVVGGYSKR